MAPPENEIIASLRREADHMRAMAFAERRRTRWWQGVGGLALLLGVGFSSGVGMHMVDEAWMTPRHAVEYTVGSQNQDAPLTSEISHEVNKKVIDLIKAGGHGAAEAVVDHSALELIQIILGRKKPRTDKHALFLDCINTIKTNVEAMRYVAEVTDKELKDGQVTEFEAIETKKCMDAYKQGDAS